VLDQRVLGRVRAGLLEVETGLAKLEDALREGECLVICPETHEIQLTGKNPLAVRPLARAG